MTGTFTLTLNLGNEAMQSEQAIAAILREVADKVDQLNLDERGTIYDNNGNSCGGWEFEINPEAEE